MAVQAASELGVEAALFYLAAYTFMVAGSFGVVTVVSRRGDVGNSLDDYRGLSRDRPVLAFVFALFLFAQAGVPLTSGFFAKFYVINAAVDAGSTWLAVIAMLTAVIAAFLYLRIIVSMYMSVEDAGRAPHDPVSRSRPVWPWPCRSSSPSGSACSPASSPSVAKDATPALVLEPADAARRPPTALAP